MAKKDIQKKSKTGQVVTPPKRRKTAEFRPILDKENYIIIAAGIFMMLLGYVLMSGGHNTDPSFFNAEGLYSTRRMVISPIVIILGVVVIVFGIFKKFNTTAETPAQST